MAVLNVYNPRLYIPLIGCIGVIALLALFGGTCLLAYGELLTMVVFQAFGSFPLVGMCSFAVAESIIGAQYRDQGIQVEGQIVERTEPKEQDISIQSLLRDVLTNQDYTSSSSRSSLSQLPKVYSVVVEYEQDRCRYRKQLTIRNEPTFLVEPSMTLLVLPSHPKTARFQSQVQNVSKRWLCVAIFISAWFAVMFWWYLPLEAMQLTTILYQCDYVEYGQTMFWCTYVVGGIASLVTNLRVSVELMNQLLHILLEGNCTEVGSDTNATDATGDDAASSSLTTDQPVASPTLYKDPSGLFGMLIV